MGEGGAPSIPAGLRVDRAPWQGPRVPLGVPARVFARRPQEITVAILAQGTHWAVALAQAFCFPGFDPPPRAPSNPREERSRRPLSPQE